MALPNVFTTEVSDGIVHRIQNLSPSSIAKWGKMCVAQMLAHCNVTYEMVYDDIHKKPAPFMRFILKMLVKQPVVNEKPYTHNSKTAPQFLINETKDFEKEKSRLIDYIQKTQKLGSAHFQGKESNSFGELSSTEWNNMFYKHLDHHLRQFGV